MEKLDMIVRKETKSVSSVVHDYGHLKRVAVGSAWFVKVMKGSKEDQELAYAAGLLHDIVRPASEKVCHAEASGEKSREILLGLKVDSQTVERIVEAVKGHRAVHEWKDALHKSVFLADKILEQMGTYVAFRRSYYVGECDDYRNMAPMEGILKHFDYRTKKFNVESFEPFFQPLAAAQYKKLTDFNSLLVRGVPWARSLTLEMYEHGKKQDARLEESIRNFRPSNKEGEAMKEEAVLYMDGKLFPRLEKMLK